MPNSNLDQPLPSLPSGLISPIPNHHSGSTFNFDYLLNNGKIYLRTRTLEDPKALVRGDLVSIKDDLDALEWKLFDDIGIPYNKNMESLLAPEEQIVEIGVASDIVVAVSNLDRVYLYKPTENNRPLHWEHILGAPDFISSDKLFLPHDRRAWAFSCSVRTKPEIRRTDFIHPNEIVSFFSDANGIHFDFGFTPTLYVLDKDGLKIVYWDTGLPASFSRGFLVPQGTQGQSISAAGSTVFLSAIDAEGKLHFFTRMIDYEINGACPGLKVSYTDIPVVEPPDGPEGSFFLGHGIRKLPLQGWVEHSVDEILPNLTHNVCIRLTGQGDEARELRIQGKDPKLGWGYYFKNISETSWTFHPEPAAAPANLAENTIIPFNPACPKTSKLSYTGKLYYRKLPHILRIEDTSDITIELKDFHPFLTDADPFSLVIHHPNEPSQHLKIHAVDAWGLHYHHHHDEELVGTVDGEPKALIGTLILTPEQIELTRDNKSSIGAYLKNHFLDYQGKTKAIPIIADNSMAILKFGPAKCCFKRSLSEEEISGSFYMRKAMAPELAITSGSLQEYTRLLDKNKECLHDIKSIFSERQKEDRRYALLNINMSFIRPLAAGVFKTIIKPEDPTYEQAIEDLGLLLNAHRKATAYSGLGRTQAPGYEQAVAILNERIKQLHEIISHAEHRPARALC
ncbi:hypothetical protein [Legionella cincinnatiensis]|uniref:Uncharacterized protein n=1 Tax=Legionella cincinnatiensis TaxID=28085 RepID=A0A378IWD1_9GAMM|nr:hypothetical protein [Legionella cincinnatiensis]KTC85314.1 hypothetical protein Lcin_1814 [Legionella cincinnatiensis]STX36324.1 Uncharacterised protein [Legionella cincinnatiensis]